MSAVGLPCWGFPSPSSWGLSWVLSSVSYLFPLPDSVSGWLLRLSGAAPPGASWGRARGSQPLRRSPVILISWFPPTLYWDWSMQPTECDQSDMPLRTLGRIQDIVGSILVPGLPFLPLLTSPPPSPSLLLLLLICLPLPLSLSFSDHSFWGRPVAMSPGVPPGRKQKPYEWASVKPQMTVASLTPSLSPPGNPPPTSTNQLSHPQIPNSQKVGDNTCVLC